MVSPKRVEVIRTLLERYNELVDPMQSRSAAGDGVPVPLMPSTYSASVREVERLLRVMRDESRHASLLSLPSGERVSVRKCWWHLNAWFLTAETVLVVPPRYPKEKRKGPHRMMLTEDGRRLPVRVVRRDPGAREVVAERGVRWLAESWALRSEPMLPTCPKCHREVFTDCVCGLLVAA